MANINIAGLPAAELRTTCSDARGSSSAHPSTGTGTCSSLPSATCRGCRPPSLLRRRRHVLLISRLVRTLRGGCSQRMGMCIYVAAFHHGRHLHSCVNPLGIVFALAGSFFWQQQPKKKGKTLFVCRGVTSYSVRCYLQQQQQHFL